MSAPESERDQKGFESDLDRLKASAEKLGEHFDSVHIFATRHEPTTADGTVTFQAGVGNWFARFGQVTEWLEKEKEKMRTSARHDQEEEE